MRQTGGPEGGRRGRGTIGDRPTPRHCCSLQAGRRQGAMPSCLTVPEGGGQEGGQTLDRTYELLQAGRALPAPASYQTT